MRHSIPTHKQSQHGFTLIEMLVVAPAIILLIGALVAFLGVLTGEALQSRAKSSMIYAVNNALDTFDRDVRYASEFRDISFTSANAQSADGNGAPFDTVNHPYHSGSYLGAVRILRSYATDKSPLDASRQLIYSTTPTAGACGTANESNNDPLQLDIVYYLKFDTTVWKYTLWRRVIHNPAQTPCPGKTAWQKPSCAPGYTDTTTCKVEDEKVLDNIPIWGPPYGYYAHIPDRSWTPDAPYYDPDPDNYNPQNGVHYIDCINPCQYWDSTHTERFDPYSRDGSGNRVQNAEMLSLTLNQNVTVAGKQVTYGATVYSRRLNSPVE